jgi:hypothetical protein
MEEGQKLSKRQLEVVSSLPPTYACCLTLSAFSHFASLRVCVSLPLTLAHS